MLSLTNGNPSEVLAALAPLIAAPEAGPSRSRARFVVLEIERHGGLPAPVSASAPASAPVNPAVPLCDWAENDPDPAVRSRAASLCAALCGVDLSTLERLARDPHWTVRARLAAALSSRRDAPDAAVVLNVLAHDVHESVRRAASGPALS